MASAAESTFDVVLWLIARARADRRELTPLGLQRLLFLAQACFAGATRGRQLMPSPFHASPIGPIEPNIARLRDLDSPAIESHELAPPLADFMEGVWQAFGTLPDDRLDRTVLSAAPVAEAMAAGRRAEITVRAMAEFYGAGGARGVVMDARGAAADKASIPRFHRGKPVAKWVPGQKRRRG